MLGRIIHWIYCLPLEDAVLLALILSAAFLWMRLRWERRRWWPGFLVVLLTIWLVAVSVNTVLSRGSESREIWLMPLHTYLTVLRGGEKELIRSGFMNVLMFYPGGLIAGSLWRRKTGRLVLLFAVASLSIELCQYILQVGVVETDDLLHNTLGALLGLLAARQFEKNKNPGGA